MWHKTDEEHYNELSEVDKKHAHTLANHYRTSIHPQDKAKLLQHVSNRDHDGMKEDIVKLAKHIGIPSIGAAGAVGIAWWALKWIAKQKV